MPKTISVDKDGVETVEYSPEEMAEAGAGLPTVIDTSPQAIERMARGFIIGSQHIKGQRDIRMDLEKKVTARIGKKGKMLVDKLFELIEGVYIVQKDGKKELRYYKVPPNLNAIIYALNRVLGTPKAAGEKEEAKKGIYVVESIIKNLAKPGQAPVVGVVSRVSEVSEPAAHE